ncbi:YtxH domain-containing protein [Parabacteroides pacaensis]|uniref:YtxH domain-containing protein n=1 Tax=Parabacteroides pacaensis TaxID=2086575 RepID=UPI000D107283|nr:YtxH domain-containing protein [Parabacteroides pacaensis]
MKGLILGIAAGVAAGYYVRKMADEGKFDKVYGEAHEFAGKAKQKIKDVVDTGKDKAEYLTEQAKSAMNKGHEHMDMAAHNINNNR